MYCEKHFERKEKNGKIRFSSRFAVPASCYVGPFHVYQVSFRFLSIKWILLQSRVKINSTCICFFGTWAFRFKGKDKVPRGLSEIQSFLLVQKNKRKSDSKIGVFHTSPFSTAINLKKNLVQKKGSTRSVP